MQLSTLELLAASLGTTDETKSQLQPSANCKIINYVRVLSQLYCRSLTLTLMSIERIPGRISKEFYLYWASYEIDIGKCHRHNLSQSHGSNLNSGMSDMTNLFLLHLHHTSSNWVSTFSRVSKLVYGVMFLSFLPTLDVGSWICPLSCRGPSCPITVKIICGAVWQSKRKKSLIS